MCNFILYTKYCIVTFIFFLKLIVWGNFRNVSNTQELPIALLSLKFRKMIPPKKIYTL